VPRRLRFSAVVVCSTIHGADHDTFITTPRSRVQNTRDGGRRHRVHMHEKAVRIHERGKYSRTTTQQRTVNVFSCRSVFAPAIVLMPARSISLRSVSLQTRAQSRRRCRRQTTARGGCTTHCACGNAVLKRYGGLGLGMTAADHSKRTSAVHPAQCTKARDS
jgi:hypothetical protein